ncbi:hypothetical protein [Bacillus paranthracis]|uniref:hypothetical protein n=1 Tax=Bacillus paranthracis TaxID=2026186 RepID=UPI0020B798AE|nr:hypothetical protein MON10_08275 [Bacillus paranthracis]
MKKYTVLNNPPSEGTKLKMVEFFMKTSVPRILAARKLEKAGRVNERIAVGE